MPAQGCFEPVKYLLNTIMSIRRSFPGIQVFRNSDSQGDGQGELPVFAEIDTSAVFGGRDGCPYGPDRSAATRAGLGGRFAPGVEVSRFQIGSVATN